MSTWYEVFWRKTSTSSLKIYLKFIWHAHKNVVFHFVFADLSFECLCLSVFCQGPHNVKCVQNRIIFGHWNIHVLNQKYYLQLQFISHLYRFQQLSKLKPFIFGLPPVSTNQESREIKEKYPVKEGKSQKASSSIYKWSRNGKWPQKEEQGREAKLKSCKIIFVYSFLGVAFSLLLIHISIKECWM